MKIALYSHTFLPSIGGREIVVLQLAKALLARGHDVRVLGPSGVRTARKMKFDFAVHRYPRFFGGKPMHRRSTQALLEWQMLPQLTFDILLWGADVIHAHSLYPSGYVASILKQNLMNVPLVLTPHGVDINVVPDAGYGMRLHNSLRDKIDTALERADRVTAISDGVHTALLQTGMKSNKVVRVANGIDIERFRGSPTSDVMSILGLPQNSKIILTVGNYSPLKGLESLIDTMQAIVQREPRARLVIVGRNTEHLHSMISVAGLSGHVVLTGSIPPPTLGDASSGSIDLLADIYRASSLYVSASNREGAEGLSLALLDAMAASLPIVATDIVGNRDVVKHGRNGRLVEINKPKDLALAIYEILAAEDIRARMGDVSLQMAVEMGWDNVAVAYESVYRAAGATGHGGAGAAFRIH